MKVVSEKGMAMDGEEVGNVLVATMFLAHSYTQDETCPLKVWHMYLFKRYCTLKVLNQAVFHIHRMQGFVLRIADVEMEERQAALSNAAKRPVRMAPKPSDER